MKTVREPAPDPSSGAQQHGAAPARQKGRERRRLILEAARKALVERGVDGLILREIAEELGITHGNLQYYFPTRNDLLVSVFDEEVAKYTTGLHEAARMTTTREGSIAAILESAFNLIEQKETKLWHVLWSVADQNPELAAVLKRENDFYEETLAGELAHILPEASNERCAHLASFIRMLVDGMAITLIYEDKRSPKYLALKNELTVFVASILSSDTSD
ncbi:MAG: TetR/AcrR family transcriptional regulator [Erythrobacter sp.]|nr:TetR/AcrR family transcriptional regulator [Erythrobacter sp.]